MTPNLKSEIPKENFEPNKDHEILANEMGLEDIHKFIDMRKDLLEKDFSFKVTRQIVNSSHQTRESSMENVFQEVLGDSMGNTRRAMEDTMMRTDDYRLTLTQPNTD